MASYTKSDMLTMLQWSIGEFAKETPSDEDMTGFFESAINAIKKAKAENKTPVLVQLANANIKTGRPKFSGSMFPEYYKALDDDD